MTTRSLPLFSFVPAALLLLVPDAWAAEPEAPAAAASAPVAAQPAVPVAAPTAAASPAPATTEAQPAPTAAVSGETVAESPYGNGAAPAAAQTPAPSPPPSQPNDKGPATLINPAANYAIGALGGLGVNYTRMVGKDAASVCLEAGVIIDHALSLGGGGCGIVTRASAEAYGPEPHDANDRLNFGYGGAIVKYHFFSREVANLSVGALLGAGGVSIATYEGPGWPDEDDDDYHHKRTEAVFVFEPQVGGYVNLTRWLRAGVTAGYRVVSGVDTQGLDESDFRGPSIGGQMQAGWF